MNVPIVITGPRQSGKTTRLVELCLDDPNGLMTVHSLDFADHIESLWPQMKGRVVPAWRMENFVPETVDPKQIRIYADELLGSELRHKWFRQIVAFSLTATTETLVPEGQP